MPDESPAFFIHKIGLMRQSEITKEVLRMVITDEIVKIKDTIISAVPVEKLYLFGSFANGTPNENSDYDFYMVIPNDSMRPLDAINKAYLAMRGLKRKPVDLLAGTVDIFSRRSEGVTLERKIAREGVILYERNDISEWVRLAEIGYSDCTPYVQNISS